MKAIENRAFRKNNKGFTLIEVIAILVLIGIATALALTGGSTDAETIGQMEQLKAYIRFAQYQAMTQATESWGIQQATDGKSYKLITSGSVTPILPDKGSDTHVLPAGITVSIPGGSVNFDEWGSPGATDKTVQVAGTISKSFTITAFTGFMQ